MNRKLVVDVLRVVLAGAILLILAVQTLFLPWLSGELARDLPDEAYMRWPILGLSVTGLLAVQVALGCLMLLLGRVRRGSVFSRGSLPLLDGIIGACLAGSVVCVATLAYQSQTVSGPPLWAFFLLAGVVAGAALALLTWVGRSLLLDVISQPTVSVARLPRAAGHT